VVVASTTGRDGRSIMDGAAARLRSEKRTGGQGRALGTPLSAKKDAGEDTSQVTRSFNRLVRVFAQRSMMLNRQSGVWISQRICRSFRIRS